MKNQLKNPFKQLQRMINSKLEEPIEMPIPLTWLNQISFEEKEKPYNDLTNCEKIDIRHKAMFERDNREPNKE